jgi:hypothetical protein
MAQLKIYTTSSSDGFLPATARAVLNLPGHVIQGNLYVAAFSKAAALRALKDAKFSTSVGVLRVASGNTLKALTDAGWLAEDGQILAMPLTGNRVVMHMASGTWEHIGDTAWNAQGYAQTFAPAEGTTAKPKALIRWEQSPGAEIDGFGYMGSVLMFIITKGPTKYWLASTFREQMGLKGTFEPMLTLAEAKAFAEVELTAFFTKLGVQPKDV